MINISRCRNAQRHSGAKPRAEHMSTNSRNGKKNPSKEPKIGASPHWANRASIGIHKESIGIPIVIIFMSAIFPEPVRQIPAT